MAETIQLRNVPSRGSRYQLETYFEASDVEWLGTRLYRYLPKSNSLVAERIDSDLSPEISTASMSFKVVTQAAITFLWVAIPYRWVWALGNRGLPECTDRGRVYLPEPHFRCRGRWSGHFSLRTLP